IALLADGHLLVEGAPGLAKTTAIKALADHIEGSFHRVQFTPDLLPGDLTGTEVYRPQSGEFQFHPGPLFHNLMLADEVNRSPAKVQSALLEAMAERQITVGGETFQLPDPFLVMATQNPIEQEGTYPLPEAQLDRFLLHVFVDYPAPEDEQRILNLARARDRRELLHEDSSSDVPPITHDELAAARKACLDVNMVEGVERYLLALVLATRNPTPFAPTLAERIRFGASPRATLALDRCARVHAWLAGRDYVTPEDIHALAPDVLRHRILLSYEAEAEGYSTDDVIRDLLKAVPSP
ncbi:MAG: AAA family ATPase, partial [Gammaproteobacteria bacterium]